jgi:ribosomal protein S18 acetylase RimI-like enzyme
MLRDTEHEDLRWVLDLERMEEHRRFVGQWSLAQHEEAIESEDHRHLVLVGSDGSPLAYVILAGLSGGVSLEFMRIVVAEKRRGAGRKAIRAVKRLAQREAFERIWLDVRPENLAARALYESEGFAAEPASASEELVVMSLALE